MSRAAGLFFTRTSHLCKLLMSPSLCRLWELRVKSIPALETSIAFHWCCMRFYPGFFFFLLCFVPALVCFSCLKTELLWLASIPRESLPRQLHRRDSEVGSGLTWLMSLIAEVATGHRRLEDCASCRMLTPESGKVNVLGTWPGAAPRGPS